MGIYCFLREEGTAILIQHQEGMLGLLKQACGPYFDCSTYIGCGNSYEGMHGNKLCFRKVDKKNDLKCI